MSDWIEYGLEDFVWDKFGKSNDHIVPHTEVRTDCNCLDNGELCKPWSKNAFGKSTGSKTSLATIVLPGKEQSRFYSHLEEGKAPMLEKGWSHANDDVYRTSFDSDCINLASGLTFEDAKTSNDCYQNGNVDSIGNEFCTDTPALAVRHAVVGDSLCHVQLDDISAAQADLEYFTSRHDQKESTDLLELGWPDIGNFDDVDRMFRSCDATFGQGNSNTSHELSWLSTSSHANDHPDSTPNSDLRSSCYEGTGLKITSEHETDQKFRTANGHLSFNNCDKEEGSNTSKKNSQNLDSNCYCSYVFDSNNHKKWERTSIDQAQESNSDEVRTSPQTFKSNESSVTGGAELENMQSKQPWGQEKMEGKREIKSSEYSKGSGVVQKILGSKNHSLAFSSKGLPQERQYLRANSFKYLHAYIPCGQQEYGHPWPTISSQKSETKNHTVSYEGTVYSSSGDQNMEISCDPPSNLSTLLPEDDIIMLNHLHQKQMTVANELQHDQPGHATITKQPPVHKRQHHVKHEIGGENEMGETAPGIDNPALPESSCMTSVLSNEVSLEATSFQQLQDVMEQLDIKTKLCIRDSLYRLARSAEQRHNFCIRDGGSRLSGGRNGTFLPEGTKKYLGFMDPETDTNPIDRSIAHLLFYTPSEPHSRPAAESVSFESHVINHGSTTMQPTTSDQLFPQEDIAGDEEI